MSERLEPLLDNRHHLWLAEPDHEKSRLVEQVDRSTCQGRTLNGRPVLGEGASDSGPEAPARHQLDLCVDVTKLPLNIANRGVGGYLILSQPHHLLRPLVFHS